MEKKKGFRIHVARRPHWRSRRGKKREVKNDVNGRRQTAKIASAFELFSSNP